MNQTTINSVVGDLLKQQDCDAIVNSAHPSMLAGSGVCGLIHRAAGKELEVYGKQFAPLELTQVVVTPAYNLPYRAIIHVNAPRFHNETDPYSRLNQSLYNVFELAEKCQLKRIALPAIGTGIYGFPIEESIKIYAQVATKFLNSNLEEIRFVFTTLENSDLMNNQLKSLK
ncbi:COG2110 Predicted phosphatase homologous to the C-terminal domain of histone macroH2A1 [Methylophilaceae bacterium]